MPLSWSEIKDRALVFPFERHRQLTSLLPEESSKMVRRRKSLLTEQEVW